MRNIISGVIGMLLGAGILAANLLGGGGGEGGSSYQTGTLVALAFAVVLLVAGVYYLRKGVKERSSTKDLRPADGAAR